MRVKDKTAIVTGGGSGLGKAIAKRLAAEGATAVIADVNQAAIDATVAEITSAGHKAWGAHVDVTNRDAVRAFMEKVAAKSGRIDILVNNAGIGLGEQIVDQPFSDFERTIRTNLFGPYSAASERDIELSAAFAAP
jgi:NAD(P)-dependent dehydrogenase (short-subunit alcohol dehydrogenase family)